MNNWDLNDSFDKLGSAYFKSYDETNNIALDISGTLAKGLAGAHFGEKDQIALKDKAVE